MCFKVEKIVAFLARRCFNVRVGSNHFLVDISEYGEEKQFRMYQKIAEVAVTKSLSNCFEDTTMQV